MELKSGFRITLFSHPDYENLTAEIHFGEHFVALISRENDKCRIELTSANDIYERRFDLDAFLEALSTARARLT
jgi:hypothetical protein